MSLNFDAIPQKKGKRQVTDIEILQEVIRNQKKEIRGMEIASELFKTHTNELLERIENLKSEHYLEIESKVTKKREKIANLRARVAELEEMLAKEQEDHVELRDTAKKESSINAEIIKRLKTMIKELQFELRSTKAIVSKPRLAPRIDAKISQSNSITPSIMASLNATIDIPFSQAPSELGTLKSPS